MKKILFLSALTLLLGFSTDAVAQRRDGRINDRADRRRVERGIRSGRITREEARDLRNRQRDIREERRGYRSDGRVTREERREIRQDEREQDRRIREYRRNDDRRERGYNDDRRERRYNDRKEDKRRGNGYYRRGAGSRSHPRFGRYNRRDRDRD